MSAAVAIAAGFIDDVAFVDAVADFAFVELDVISTIVFFIDDVAAHVVEFRQCQRLNFGIVQVFEIDLVSVHFFLPFLLLEVTASVVCFYSIP